MLIYYSVIDRSIGKVEKMFEHTTVLLKEAVDGLNIKPDGIYVDCTLGGAGHSSFILSKLIKWKYLHLTRMKQRLYMQKKS